MTFSSKPVQDFKVSKAEVPKPNSRDAEARGEARGTSLRGIGASILPSATAFA